MRMGRRLLLVVAVLVLVALVATGVGVLTGGDGDAPSAQPTPTDSPDPTPTVATASYDVYLAVGDSLAAGYQPANPGDRTDREGGYAGAVRAGLAGNGQAPDLVNLGCPGETTATLVAGGTCTYAEGGQLAAVEAALASAPDSGARTLVTVQVGANDVQRCVRLDGEAPSVDEECVAAGLASVRTLLPEALQRIRRAAPQARVVVLDYYNPFAVAALLGPALEPLAARSEQVQAELNELITSIGQQAGADVTDVETAFSGGEEASVGPICSLTWMCGDPPDVHATTAGYELMAAQVLGALRGS